MLEIYANGGRTLYCARPFSKVRGYGPFSKAYEFVVDHSLQERVADEDTGTLRQPPQPQLVWRRLETAVRYQLHLTGPNSEEFRRTFQDQAVCSEDGLCRLTWAEQLAPGDWTWMIRAFHDTDIRLARVYSVERMVEAVCPGMQPSECRSSSEKFRRMEADMHNLFPVWDLVEKERRGKRFGMVQGEVDLIFGCDFETDERLGKVEPPANAGGDIARTMLYMHVTYELPLTEAELLLFKGWRHADRVSRFEVWRNRIIREIQGQDNPFISDAERIYLPKKGRTVRKR